jgi:hypothetical protein
LLVHPGASVSISDVYEGFLPALKGLGHDVWLYNMDQRITESGAWLAQLHKRRRRSEPDFPRRATPATVLAHAAQDILARALWNDIDWVVVVSGMYLHPDIAILFQKLNRGKAYHDRKKVAVLLTESPYDDGHQANLIQYVDLAWTNERTSANYLRQWNPNVYYLPHSYNTEKVSVPGTRNPDLPSHDVLFIGTGFEERVQMLEAVNWDGIDFGLYGVWELLGSRNRLRKHLRGSYVENSTAQQMYGNAKINLNLYRTSMGFGRNTERIHDAESLNPRALELAAGGCFHLSDPRAEVIETFGTNVPTFTNAAELEAHIRTYLGNPRAREVMAAQLPAAVRGFTFEERAKQVIHDLEAYETSFSPL